MVMEDMEALVVMEDMETLVVMEGHGSISGYGGTWKH